MGQHDFVWRLECAQQIDHQSLPPSSALRLFTEPSYSAPRLAFSTSSSIRASRCAVRAAPSRATQRCLHAPSSVSTRMATSSATYRPVLGELQGGGWQARHVLARAYCCSNHKTELLQLILQEWECFAVARKAVVMLPKGVIKGFIANKLWKLQILGYVKTQPTRARSRSAARPASLSSLSLLNSRSRARSTCSKCITRAARVPTSSFKERTLDTKSRSKMTGKRVGGP